MTADGWIGDMTGDRSTPLSMITLRSRTPVIYTAVIWIVCMPATVVSTIEAVPTAPLCWIALLVSSALLVRSTRIRAIYLDGVLSIHSWFQNRDFPLDERCLVRAIPYSGFLNQHSLVGDVRNLWRYMLIVNTYSGRSIELPATIGSQKSLQRFATAVSNRAMRSSETLAAPDDTQGFWSSQELKARTAEAARSRDPTEAIRLFSEWPEAHRGEFFWRRVTEAFDQAGDTEKAWEAELLADLLREDI